MFCLADKNNWRRWRRIFECSCCTCCICYDRLSSEDVLVITSCTARARQKIFISSTHFPKKIGLGSADFLHSGTGYIEIAVFVLLLIFCRFQFGTHNKKASIRWQHSAPPRASNGGRSLCVQISRERSYPLPIYWYHSKGNWLRYNFATDSFYIMKFCSRLLVLYCRNCPKDDKFRHFIPILRKLAAS